MPRMKLKQALELAARLEESREFARDCNFVLDVIRANPKAHYSDLERICKGAVSEKRLYLVLRYLKNKRRVIRVSEYELNQDRFDAIMALAGMLHDDGVLTGDAKQILCDVVVAYTAISKNPTFRREIITNMLLPKMSYIRIDRALRYLRKTGAAVLDDKYIILNSKPVSVSEVDAGEEENDG